MVYRFSNIRTELGFGTMPDESIEYSRKGGCFVSLCKGVCISFLLLFFITFLLVIVFFSTRHAYEKHSGVSLEEFVRKPSPFIDKTDRLAKLFSPKSYRLIIHPHFNENDSQQYLTFEGIVWIVVAARRGNNRKIELNVKNLKINEEDVLVYKSFKVPDLKNVSLSYLENINYLNIYGYSRKKRQSDDDGDDDDDNNDNPGDVVDDDDEIEIENVEMTTIIDEDDSEHATLIPNASTPDDGEFDSTTPDDLLSTTSETGATVADKEIPCDTSNEDNETEDDEDDDLVLKKINRVDFDEDDEIMIISLDVELRRNIFYTVKVNFSGNMTIDKGLFYKTFKTNETGSSFLAGTFTTPDSARMILPCFDDDDFQSIFDISIIRSPEVRTASNAKINNTIIVGENLVMDNYYPTPPMPASELGFIITNIKSFNLEINDNLSLQLFTQEENVEKVETTMRAIQNVVNIIENYTRVPFNMNELSYVILPHQQNYREIKRGIILTSEYYIPISTDAYLSNKEITNELAFQWFDGINQYELDEEIWLKKAIPLFLQQIALDANDESDYYEAEYFDLKSRIMQDEMFFSNFKLTREIDEDRLDFDTMNFMQKKGLCVLKMFNYTLTTNIFREAIAEYFKKRTHNQTIEFYSTLQDANFKVNPTNTLNLPQIFDQWINYDEIPIIYINKNGNNYVLKQKVLNYDKTDPGEHVRTIPITYRHYNGDEDRIFWLTKREQCLETSQNHSYILLNPSGTGYFRTSYDNITWNKILQDLEINHAEFTVISRAVLIDDAFNLARFGVLDYKVVFSIISCFKKNEKSLIPWTVVFNNFDYMYRNMQSLPNFYYLLEFIKSTIETVDSNLISLSEVENLSEQNEISNLKNLIEKWSCKLGLTLCIQKQRAEFEILLENNLENLSKTEDNLLLILCTNIKYGGWDEWNKIYNKISTSDYYTSILIKSLGCTREPVLMTRFIHLLLDDQELSEIYAFDLIEAIGDNEILLKYVMEYFYENWIEIRDNYTLQELFPILKRISTERELKILQSIFSKYSITFLDNDKQICRHILHSITTTLKWKNEIARKITKNHFHFKSQSDVEFLL